VVVLGGAFRLARLAGTSLGPINAIRVQSPAGAAQIAKLKH
jgi:hypothetical protein